MHTTTPTIMSMEQNKNCVDDENDGDVLKQETQDLAGLLSSPDTKPRQQHEINSNGVKSELGSDIKEESKDENAVKQEPVNPGSVGKLPNGDANIDLDKKVGTPGDIKPQEKAKQEPNGNPNTPIMGDGQQQAQQPPGGGMGQMHRGNMGMGMSPGAAPMGQMGMGPQQGPMPQGGPMGPGPVAGPGGPVQGPGGMMGQMGPGPMGPNGGPQHQVASDGQLIQQQSEIFVFTTQLANDAAQAVQTGQYKNILSYHMDQPNTKKFLQKHQKCRPGPGGMGGMYGMSNMRSKMGGGGGMMNNPMGSPMGMSGPGGPMSGPMGYGPGPGPNSSNSVEQWVRQQNQNLQEQGLNMSEGDPRMMMGPNNPNFSQMMMDERMFDPEFGGPGGPGINNMNLMQSKVPNENLTPEQLQRREEHLASLRKIQQMLFPEQRGQHGFPTGPGGPGQGPGPGPGPGGQGMMPGDMSMYQQNLMSKRAMMVSQQNMMSSPHGMMDSRMEMMSQEQFMMSQGMSQCGPGPHPQNMQNLTPAQREWMRLQQEHMIEKRQRAQMGPNGPQMGSGPGPGPGMDPTRGMQGQPPPSYYSSIAQKRHGSVGMASPTSPNMNGPLGSPSMGPAGADPNDPLMFPGHQRKGSFSGMDGMGPGMGPGGMGPAGLDMMQQGSPMNSNMMGPMGNMPPHGLKNSQVSLQRAGNPEQFVPDIPPVSGTNNSTNKPPPSYAQSQSTKRKREDMEELCKNLQPTPSPQHMGYLSQFDGQELTITKQINTAYRDTNTSESQSNHFTQNQAVNSPMHGPGSNKGPMSNSSQTSSGPLASPGPVTVTQGSGQGPGPSPLSGANKRLSHFDPQQQPQQQPAPPQNSSISNSPTTPTGKSSLSNITSASLANLALGVENLSNQMQQHMMQGGPFHSIQMQSQQQQAANQNPPHSQPGQSQQSSTSQPTSQHPAVNSTASNTSQTPSTPSVNNTYVNANLSIQQVNIQSVNQGNGNGYNGGASSASSMQVSQMNMEQTQMNMQQQQQQQQSGANNSSMPAAGTMTQTGSMAQTTNMTQSRSMTPSSGMPSNNKMPPSSMNMPSGMKDNNPMSCPSSMPQGYSGMGPPGMHKMSPFAQSQNPINSMMNQQVPTSGHPGSPGYPASSMGNANVQIQQKAPNTIQYLPANQSSMPPETKSVGKPDLDFMNQFTNPMMDGGGKVPTSKLQYFQGGGNPYGPGGMGGPGAGPGQEPRMGPSMAMGQDPRLIAQSMAMGSDPRMDPRMGPSAMAGDPRMGPMGPSSDPRMIPTSRHDSRMGPDMGMSPDPRMGPAGIGGPMTDPRMGPMSMGPGSGPGGAMSSMRPGSRGSPFTGPIGPAVQQSMMMRRGSPDIAMSGSNFSAISGMGSPDPMNPNMSSMGGNPMSALSSMSGNPMTSMSNMSNSIMSDPMGPMSGGPSSGGMGPNMPYNSPPYSGSMMPSGPGAMSMQGSRMQGPGGMGSMSRSGPYSRQPSPGMRMSGPAGMGPGPGPVSPGAQGYSSAQYQQFQQQLYSQSRSRQMSPMESMMGQPGYGGPMGMGAGMMPNMHGPM